MPCLGCLGPPADRFFLDLLPSLSIGFSTEIVTIQSRGLTRPTRSGKFVKDVVSKPEYRSPLSYLRGMNEFVPRFVQKNSMGAGSSAGKS